MRKRFVFLALLISFGALVFAFELKDGDRVAFYGDSITEMGGYVRDIQDYVITRYPDLKISFINLGIGGDRVSGGAAGPIDRRISRDVVPYQPTVVTICLGMNDGEYQPFKQEIYDRYYKGLEHIVSRIRKECPKARLFILGPPAFDDVTRGDSTYNNSLRRISDGAKLIAKKYKAKFVDTNTPMVKVLEALKKNGSNALILPDRVHPDPGGHWIMAHAVLKAWGATAEVASIKIDVVECNATAKNADVLMVARNTKGVSFTTKQHRLPLPLDLNHASIKAVFDVTSIEKDLSREMLVVSGLESGNFLLKVNETELGQFSAKQLATGINVASNPGFPLQHQALALAKKTNERHALAYLIWRRIYVPAWDEPKQATDKDWPPVRWKEAEDMLAVEQASVKAQGWLRWVIVKQ